MSNAVAIVIAVFYVLARIELYQVHRITGLQLQLKDKELSRLTDILAARSAAEYITIRQDGHKPAQRQTESRPKIPADAITDV